MRKRTGLKESLIKNKVILIAFILPVIIMEGTFALHGVYPFGTQQIPVIDMYHQYVPFLSELQDKLQSGGSLFYTWNGAGGCNFWNLIAYYGASPLNLLLILVPAKVLTEGVTIILLIKTGLAGSFMAMYLRYMNGRGGYSTAAFSTLYALSSFVMSYYWCIMWMDAVMLLPLCITGLHRLMDRGRTVMYTVTLALIVFSNYYMAIMVCIFILIYYPVIYFQKEKKGRMGCLKVTANAVGHSFLAIAMAAVMLLPTYISMQTTYYISSGMPDHVRTYNDGIDIINQMLPATEVTCREGLPNLYCGLIVVIMMVIYFIAKDIRLKEKLLNLGLLAFFFLSLNINILDFIWHGFHFPNQLPYRYTFVVSFVMVGMAYRAFMRIGDVKVKHLWIILAAGVSYLLIAQKIMKENLDRPDIFLYGGILLLGMYIGLMVTYRKGCTDRRTAAAAVCVLMMCETAMSAFIYVDEVGTSQRRAYRENLDDVAKIVEKVDDEFVRVEMNDNYILNCPALYHYRGISQFSSSINAGTTAIMEKIGIEGAPAKNRFNYNRTDPVTDAILNIKYVIGKNIEIEDEHYDLIDTEGSTTLYENRYPLSIGYMTGEEMRTWDWEMDNPFDVLDDYVRAASSNRYDGVFTGLKGTMGGLRDLAVKSAGDDMWTAEKLREEGKARAVISYEAERDGNHYLFIEAENAGDITVNSGDRAREIDIRNDCGSIVNIGKLRKGQEVDVTIDYRKALAGTIVSHMCTMDEKVWKDFYGIISSSMMEVTDFSDRSLTGEIDVREDGILMTSIPYDRGWTIEVDGRERRAGELAGGAFITLPLDRGHHEIEMRFMPPGFTAGLIVTLIAVLILAGERTVIRRIKKRA